MSWKFYKHLHNFITNSNIFHNYKYKYTNVKYINALTKVSIICPIHGNFFQTPNNHLNMKQGCPECGGTKKITCEEFINKSNSKHNKYFYNLINYKNLNHKVDILCSTHGIFKQSPIVHLNGSGCPKCSKNHKYTNNEYIKTCSLKHNNKYDYSKVKYVNSKSKIAIICPIHGEFTQNAGRHIEGKGCKKCANILLNLNTEDFIIRSNKQHGNKYQYNKSIYIDNKTKILITCPVHGDFSQVASAHIYGNGCPNCKLSKGEDKIFNILSSNKILFETQKTFKDCVDKKLLRFDFYLPDYNTCIEYDGIQHFEEVEFFGGRSSFVDTQRRDAIKTHYCKTNNINLLRISYKDNIQNKIKEIYEF